MEISRCAAFFWTLWSVESMKNKIGQKNEIVVVLCYYKLLSVLK